jgi:hypothetical protein
MRPACVWKGLSIACRCMPEEKPVPSSPEATGVSIKPVPLSEVVSRTLLELAEWQEVTERMKERVRTSKLKPPEEPPEIIP